MAIQILASGETIVTERCSRHRREHPADAPFPLCLAEIQRGNEAAAILRYRANRAVVMADLAETESAGAALDHERFERNRDLAVRLNHLMGVPGYEDVAVDPEPPEGDSGAVVAVVLMVVIVGSVVLSLVPPIVHNLAALWQTGGAR
jgi:hypothetical protein